MDVTIIAELIFKLITAVAVIIVIPGIKMLIAAKTNAATADKIFALVQVFVTAAEQLFDKDKGAAKKAYVLAQLHDAGYDIDSKELDAMIEACVYELHNAIA